MGVPENPTLGQEASTTQPFAPSTPPVNTNQHEIQPVQQAVVPASETLPPAYEKSANGPGTPRNDDVGRQEMAYNANPQPILVTPLQNLNQQPSWIDCPFCNQRSETDVRKTESDTTWLYTLLCCICCGCIGAIFPLVLGWGNDFDHHCKKCGNRVARVPHEGASNATVQVFAPQPAVAVPSKHT